MSSPSAARLFKLERLFIEFCLRSRSIRKGRVATAIRFGHTLGKLNYQVVPEIDCSQSLIVRKVAADHIQRLGNFESYHHQRCKSNGQSICRQIMRIPRLIAISLSPALIYSSGT